MWNKLSYDLKKLGRRYEYFGKKNIRTNKAKVTSFFTNKERTFVKIKAWDLNENRLLVIHAWMSQQNLFKDLKVGETYYFESYWDNERKSLNFFMVHNKSQWEKVINERNKKIELEYKMGSGKWSKENKFTDPDLHKGKKYVIDPDKELPF